MCKLGTSFVNLHLFKKNEDRDSKHEFHRKCYRWEWQGSKGWGVGGDETYL